MITLIIYIIGGVIGLLLYVLFGGNSLLYSFAQFSIFLSFLYTFIGRLIPNVRYSLIQMVPLKIPFPTFIVYSTGLLELVISIGILFEQTQSFSSIIGIILCVSLFPANVKAHKEGVRLNGNEPTNIWLRLIIQILFILSFVIILRGQS